VLRVLVFPFGLWEITTIWHGPVVVWLVRHPIRALAGLGKMGAEGPLAIVLFIGGCLFFLAAWWLTTPPAKGTAPDRWRWFLVRWTFLALLLLPIVGSALQTLLKIRQKLPLMGTAVSGLPLYVLFAAILLVIFAELGDKRGQLLALGLVGLQICDQIIHTVGNPAAGIRQTVLALAVFFAILSTEVYLLLRLGWPKERHLMEQPTGILVGGAPGP